MLDPQTKTDGQTIVGSGLARPLDHPIKIGGRTATGDMMPHHPDGNVGSLRPKEESRASAGPLEVTTETAEAASTKKKRRSEASACSVVL